MHTLRGPNKVEPHLDRSGQPAWTGGTGTHTATRNTNSVTDTALQAFVTLPTIGNGHSGGLLLRSVGTSYRDYYVGQLVRTNGRVLVQIVRVLNGASRVLAQAPGADSGLLRFEAQGNALRLSLDGHEPLLAQDNSFAAGLTGIRQSGDTYLDDFLAE